MSREDVLRKDIPTGVTSSVKVMARTSLAAEGLKEASRDGSQRAAERWQERHGELP